MLVFCYFLQSIFRGFSGVLEKYFLQQLGDLPSLPDVLSSIIISSIVEQAAVKPRVDSRDFLSFIIIGLASIYGSTASHTNLTILPSSLLLSPSLSPQHIQVFLAKLPFTQTLGFSSQSNEIIRSLTLILPNFRYSTSNPLRQFLSILTPSFHPNLFLLLTNLLLFQTNTLSSLTTPFQLNSSTQTTLLMCQCCPLLHSQISIYFQQVWSEGANSTYSSQSLEVCGSIHI